MAPSPGKSKRSADFVDRSHLLAQQRTGGIRSAFLLALRLLDRRDRIPLIIVAVLTFANAFVGVLGLSSVLPFIYLMVSPTPLEGDNYIAEGLRFLGFTDEWTAFVWAGVALVTLILAKAVLALAHIRLVERFCMGLEVRMATRLLSRLTIVPFVWIVGRNGTVLREIALSRTSEWARGAVRMVLQIASDGLFLVIGVAAIVVINPVAGSIVILSGGIMGFVLLLVSRAPLVRLAEQKRIFARRALLAATEAIMGGRDVRTYRVGGLLAQAFQYDQSRFADAEVSGKLMQAVPRQGMEVIGAAILVVVSLTLLVLEPNKDAAAATLIACGVIAIRCMPLIGQLVNSVATLTASSPSVQELASFAKELSDLMPRNAKPGQADFSNWQECSVDRVRFEYPGRDVPAVKSVAFVIGRGERIALVGSSGSGKSTLLDMLVALLTPSSGTIRIDGKQLTEQFAADWQDQIAYVTQTPFLLDGTLMDNVILAQERSQETELACRKAMVRAGLGPLLQELPDGLLTRAGDLGTKLSGGQRQRVAIARAIYRKASILVFDEATSALDPQTEHEVVNSIFEFGRDVTLIFAAHRMSIAKRCDRIAVMHAGELVDIGSHEDLVKRCPAYQVLIRSGELADNSTDGGPGVG